MVKIKKTNFSRLVIGKCEICVLVIIVLLAAFLRFYKLDQIPPSLNWDEAAAGYNAYTIAHWGADEYGQKFPITFKSFGDYKHPVHIYLTAPIVGLFGLNDYSARASSAIVGTLAVLTIYFLVKYLTKSGISGIFSALFLAVSPYSLQYSRGLWEANFALFFFILGITLFYSGIKNKNWLIPASFFSFGISFFSYHSAKVVVPPVVLFLVFSNIKNLFQNKKATIAALAIGLFFGFLILKDPNILGFARIEQTRFSQEEMNRYGGALPIYWNNYKQYFSYSYLFDKGDQNPRGSVKVLGEFYKIDMILTLAGIIALIFKKKWKTLFLILLCLALSPIPGALSQTIPGSTRGVFMIGPIIALSGIGAGSLIETVNRNWIKIIIGLAIITVLTYEVKNYLNYYYAKYSEADAIEWQYGMKQIVAHLKKNPEYIQVYMDKIRQQPYIFFLFYFKTPLPEFLESVEYDQSESRSYNTVVSFDKYQFGGNWNIIESVPTCGVTYIMTPSYRTGLRYAADLETMDVIKYPDRSDAFYIVEGCKQ